MPAFLRRVALRYYRSIKACDVRLEGLTALVGQNGAGKSNFVDALRFVRDGLRYTLEHAVQDRGGIDAVRTRSGGHPTHFGIDLSLDLGDGVDAIYGFKIRAQANGGFAVQQENCRVRRFFESHAHFIVRDGHLQDAHAKLESVVEPDRLFLTTVSARPEFRPLYDGLSSMGFYNLNPVRIRDLQDPDPGLLLSGDGGNLASVLREMGRTDARAKQRVEDYLKEIVPGLESIDFKALGPKVTLEFRQDVGQSHPWYFPAHSMSDGTLRALAILVAAFQGRANGRGRVPLIAIEEPEVAIHPGAARVVAEALSKASNHVQILLTTHSPDLLEHESFGDDSLRAVQWNRGTTVIAKVDPGSREAIREGLFSAGELLRLRQLEPDPDELAAESLQSTFDFDPPEEE